MRDRQSVSFSVCAGLSWRCVPAGRPDEDSVLGDFQCDSQEETSAEAASNLQTDEQDEDGRRLPPCFKDLLIIRTCRCSERTEALIISGFSP